MLNIFDDVSINYGLKLSKKELIKLLVDNKEYLNSIDPHDLMKLYEKTGLKVLRLFQKKDVFFSVDRHSFEANNIVIYDQFKSNIIQKIEKVRETSKDEEELVSLIREIDNNITLVTNIDDILYTRKNGHIYSITIIKDKIKYTLKLEGIFDTKSDIINK